MKEISLISFFDTLFITLSTISAMKVLNVLKIKFRCLFLAFFNMFKDHWKISVFEINIGY